MYDQEHAYECYLHGSLQQPRKAPPPETIFTLAMLTTIYDFFNRSDRHSAVHTNIYAHAAYTVVQASHTRDEQATSNTRKLQRAPQAT